MSIFTLELAKKLWSELGDIPCNEDCEIDVEFNAAELGTVFEVGTETTEIWHWFEETFNLSIVEDLMYQD